MNDESIFLELSRLGIEIDVDSSQWKESMGLLAALDAIGRRGATAIIKVDGGRVDAAAYTIVVSGGLLGEAFFRKDGSDLRSLLRDAIHFYAAHAERDGPGRP